MCTRCCCSVVGRVGPHRQVVDVERRVALPNAVASSWTRAIAPPPGTSDHLASAARPAAVRVLDERVDRLVGQLGEEVGRSSSSACPFGLPRRRAAAAPRRTASARPGRSPAGRTRAAARAPPRPPRRARRSSTTMPTTGWPRTGSGTKSSGGAVMNASAAADLVGRVEHEVAVERARGRRAIARRVHEHAAEHDRADRVQPEVERGDDAEVAAAAAQPPEQVGVLVGRRGHHAAVGRDDLGRRAGCRT